MKRTSMTSLAFAAVCMTAIAAAPGAYAADMAQNGPQPGGMSSGAMGGGMPGPGPQMAPPPGTPMPAPPMGGSQGAMNGGPMNGGSMPAEPMNGDGGAPPQLVTNGPQSDPGDSAGSRAAQQNVRESDQYEALVHSNPGFRASRIQKECGSINDPQLHSSCVASFGSGDGSAMRPHRHHQRDSDQDN